MQSEKLNVLLSRIDRAELLQFLPGSRPIVLKVAAHCLLIGNLPIPSWIVDVRAQPFENDRQLSLAIQLEIAAHEILDVGIERVNIDLHDVQWPHRHPVHDRRRVGPVPDCVLGNIGP